MACVVSDGKALTRTRANLIGKRTTQQHAAYSSKNGKGSKPNSFFFKPPTPIFVKERTRKCLPILMLSFLFHGRLQLFLLFTFH